MTATATTPAQREFRSAMANLSAGVNIVTTDGPGGRAGITVSAVCSVTDSPPTMLVCINKDSYTHDIFRTNGRIGINVLGRSHEDVALTFAGATDAFGDERFAPDAWDTVGGVPVLRGSAASITGRIADITVQGSHSVIFVEVERIVRSPESGGLVYFQRKFHPIHAALPA